ncbi:hypothetical protein Q7P35_008631 [Cladosporium inversicolor]
MSSIHLERLWSSATASPVALFAIFCAASAIAWSLLLRSQTTKSIATPTSTSPQPFQTPLPTPLENFDLNASEPQVYRPFRHGKTHVTMGIRKLDWDNWIEMDSNYERYHDLKVAELEKDIDAHVQYYDDDVTKDACFEMLEELTKYLTHRYPRIFSLADGVLHNSVTGEKLRYPAESPKEALATAARLVQDDLVLMVKRDDDEYHLNAGAVCLPGFWRLREKFGMSLDTLHFEAKVPHYGAKLQKSMNRFFKTMTPEKPVTRNNFFIQLDDGLHWSHRMGDQKGEEVASWESANSRGLQVGEIHFRSERQTLRRLPRSGALMFTIRTYFEPMTAIAKEPHVPGRLAEAIRNWDDDISVYKGRSHWDHLLLPYLDEQHQLQVDSGILEKPEGEFPY